MIREGEVLLMDGAGGVPRSEAIVFGARLQLFRLCSSVRMAEEEASSAWRAMIPGAPEVVGAGCKSSCK